jgi:glycosyltransferase involved in cell wall biosynthesis
MSKHIIITKLFEFGGSNTHLKALIKYFGEENVVLLLEDQNQLGYLETLGFSSDLKVKITSKLLAYAHLRYRFTTNIKEIFHIVRSIIAIQILSIRYGFADITISEVEPEKHLYLLWLPLSKVTYILHTTPNKKYTPFTSYTCNATLGKRRRILTVSNSNRDLICENWEVSPTKAPFISVVYNCLIEGEYKNALISHQKDNGQYVVTLGHVITYKNPSTWLEVAKIVTSKRENVHFIWIGNGPLWEDFKKATEKYERITFKNAVVDPSAFLKNSIIYYQPSLQETQGIAVVEAMYNHLPCVVSNVGGLPESVQHQFNGLLVHPTMVSEHVNAILSLIDDTALRKEYGLNAYNKCKKSFCFNSFKSSMDLIYV